MHRSSWLRLPLSVAYVLSLAGALFYGCSSDEGDSTTSATSNTGASGTGASSSGGAGTGGDVLSASGGTGVGGSGVGGLVGTGGATQPCIDGDSECTDCIDNDGDGFIDAFDVACVGPLDDDESSFATGIPGDNIDCKQDCFFDGNSGSGNDGCEWNIQCDMDSPGAPKCPYDPKCAEPNDPCHCGDAQSDACKNFCQAFTPNGCDCFGCCEVTLPDQVTTVFVFLGSDGCTEAELTNPQICKTCTQSTDCVNTCDTCEYCLGKTQLPPECNQTPDGGSGGSGGSDQCNGDQPCDPSHPCLDPQKPYCLTGCCIEIPA